ncbi:MAG: glycosyltransferase family 2 protein, partial [Saprospiraceae bacterium]
MHNSPHIALIFVHYFTPKLLETALLSVIADLENEHYQYEIMVVNNGGDLNDLSDKIAFQNIVKWIHPLTNTGYAGGVNLGISKSNADYFIISNPDVLFCAGAIKALVEPLVKGQAVATGPQLFLDKKKQFKLPPLEPFTATAILLRQLAPYSHIFAKYWRKRWQRDTYQHWLATKPINSYQLSGAVMGIERGVWEELDGFDEKYPLYFEETDWLMRLKKSKQAALFIPNAEVIHFYNQSAAHEKRAAEWYRVSERRFFKKHFSRLFLYPLRLL